MPGAKRLTAFDRVQLPAWEYLGGETLTNPSDTALTLPSDVSAIVIGSENADCYYAINGAVASADSPGFIPTDAVATIGPLSVLTGVRVHSAGIVHVQYFREV